MSCSNLETVLEPILNVQKENVNGESKATSKFDLRPKLRCGRRRAGFGDHACSGSRRDRIGTGADLHLRCALYVYGLARRRSSLRRFSAGRAGQPVWHYQPGRRSCLHEWLRNGVQGGYDRQGNRALQLHWWGGRRNPLRRFSAGRAGQPVWHYQPGRRSCLHEWLRNGVQGGYDRQENRALQLHRWGGWRNPLRRFSAGRAGQLVWHGPAGRKSRVHGTHEWLRNGVQADTCGTDHDYDCFVGKSCDFRGHRDLHRNREVDDGHPSGMVTFKDGSATLVTVMLSGGQARFSTANLAVGSHSITAVYAGSLNPSTSAVLTQTITKAATTALVVSSKNPSISKTVVTFTATVKSTTKGTPTGTVTFQDGGATLGTSTLIGGQARFSTTKLAVGSHSITAVYGGDGNFNPSTSPVLTQKVNP